MNIIEQIDRDHLLIDIQEEAKNDPNFLSIAVRVMTAGVVDAANHARAREVEWEIIAAMASCQKLDANTKNVVADKIEKMLPHAACNGWKRIIDKARS